jgi:large conductance mechanosensitive channel
MKKIKLTKEEKKELKRKTKENSKSLLEDFKKFITRGNVIDLAVGMIIGSSFTAIVSALVQGIIMPAINLINPKGVGDIYLGIGKLVTVTAEEQSVVAANGQTYLAGESYYKQYLNFSTFLNAIINFLLVAICLFLFARMVKAIASKISRERQRIYEKTHEKEIEAQKLAEKEAADKKLEEERLAKEKLVEKETQEENYKKANVELLTEIRDLLKTK